MNIKMQLLHCAYVCKITFITVIITKICKQDIAIKLLLNKTDNIKIEIV